MNSATIAPLSPEHVLPLPRVLEDIERKHAARRFADGRPDPAIVRVFYLLQLYAGPHGTGEVQAGEIARRLHLSRQAVSLALRRLVGLRLITLARRLDGKWMVVRFLFREIYRLFKRGCSRLVNGVLSFCSSFPQAVSPVVHKEEARGVTTENPKDGRRPSIHSPGALLGRLRRAAEAFNLQSDRRSKALIGAVGRLVFHDRRFRDFQANPGAALELEAVIRSSFAGAPPWTAGVRRLWKWARGLVEDTLQIERLRNAVPEDPDEGCEYVSVAGLMAELLSGAKSGCGVIGMSDAEKSARYTALSTVDDARRAYAERVRLAKETAENRTAAEREALRQAARDRFAAWCSDHEDSRVHA